MVDVGVLMAGICVHNCSNSAQTPQQQSSSGASAMQSSASTPDSTPSTRDGSPGSVTLQMKHQYALANQRTPPTPDVRLYHRAVVVAQDTPGQYSQLIPSRTLMPDWNPRS